MLDRLARRLYARLGARYPYVFAVVNVAAALFAALVTLLLVASYYDPSLDEFALVAAATSVATTAAVAFALLRARDVFRRIFAEVEAKAG